MNYTPHRSRLEVIAIKLHKRIIKKPGAPVSCKTATSLRILCLCSWYYMLCYERELHYEPMEYTRMAVRNNALRI